MPIVRRSRNAGRQLEDDVRHNEIRTAVRFFGHGIDSRRWERFGVGLEFDRRDVEWLWRLVYDQGSDLPEDVEMTDC